MKITETKELYEEFKYFKSIYTKINISEQLQLIGDSKNNVVHIHFVRSSSYSNLLGTLKGNTKFLNWLKDDDKVVMVNMEDLIEIGKTLKKNAESVSYNENEFTFEFKTKEDISKSIITKRVQKEAAEKIKSAFFSLVINFDNNIELDESFLKTDIIEIFNSAEGITKNRTKDKIIEIPKARLNSYIKDEKIYLQFSDKDLNNTRYVSLQSESETLGLKLIEIFKTI